MTISDFFSTIFTGNNLAFLGAALATFLAGIGSIRGVSLAAKAAMGVLAEDPSKFGKLFLVMALPMTQGIYGFVIGFLILFKIGVVGGAEILALTAGQGGYYLMASLPIAISGLLSGVKQGEVAASGIVLLGKRPEEQGHAITTTALVETYAILGFLISVLLVLAA